MPASWLRLSLRTDPAAFDAVGNFLIERGAPGVVLKKNEIQAYFAHSAEDGAIRNDVRRFLRGLARVYPDAAAARARWNVIKDKNWNSAWRKFFVPQKIGRRFCVAPPWAELPDLKRRQLITIEPGMAFGTGTHATTRGCLELIEIVARRFAGAPFSALDVGTGSGILAIALAKLGAKKVWAIDNDPVALQVARENVRANRVEKKIKIAATRLNAVRKAFPVVVANLTAETLIELAPALQQKVALRGYLILSGILPAKAAGVIDSFSDRFRVAGRKTDKKWVTLLLVRR